MHKATAAALLDAGLSEVPILSFVVKENISLSETKPNEILELFCVWQPLTLEF